MFFSIALLIVGIANSQINFLCYYIITVFSIANWTPKIGEEAVVKNIHAALDSWGRYGRLNFYQVHDPAADIIVAFGRGSHGDG